MTTYLSLPAKTTELLAKFRTCTASQVIDAMEDVGLQDAHLSVAAGLKPLDRNGGTMAGLAVTIQEGPRRVGSKEHRLSRHAEQMRQMGPGQVLVIAGGGSLDYASWGGLLHMEARHRAIEGVVLDGAVRDFSQIIATKLPVYCKGTNPLSDHYLASAVSVDAPIVCAGVHVKPGDFVVGDCDGVCFVPQEFAEPVLEASLKRAAEEIVRERKFLPRS